MRYQLLTQCGQCVVPLAVDRHLSVSSRAQTCREFGRRNPLLASADALRSVGEADSADANNGSACHERSEALTADAFRIYIAFIYPPGASAKGCEAARKGGFCV
jgi:hypothetical protein